MLHQVGVSFDWIHVFTVGTKGTSKILNWRVGELDWDQCWTLEESYIFTYTFLVESFMYVHFVGQNSNIVFVTTSFNLLAPELFFFNFITPCI